MLAGEGSLSHDRYLYSLDSIIGMASNIHIYRFKKNFASTQLCFKESLFNIRHTLRNGSNLHLALKLELYEKKMTDEYGVFFSRM